MATAVPQPYTRSRSSWSAKRSRCVCTGRASPVESQQWGALSLSLSLSLLGCQRAPLESQPSTSAAAVSHFAYAGPPEADEPDPLDVSNEFLDAIRGEFSCEVRVLVPVDGHLKVWISVFGPETNRRELLDLLPAADGRRFVDVRHLLPQASPAQFSANVVLEGTDRRLSDAGAYQIVFVPGSPPSLVETHEFKPKSMDVSDSIEVRRSPHRYNIADEGVGEEIEAQ